MVSSGRNVGDVCPICGGYLTAAVEAPIVQRPCGPRRKSVENQSPQGKGHSPDGGEMGVHLVTFSTQAKERKSILFRALFLKERNSSCDALGPSRFPKLQLTRESLFCAEAQKPPAHRTWPRPGSGAWDAAEPGPEAATPGPSKGRAVQKSRSLLASGMSSGKPCSPRRDARSNSPLLLP